MTVVGNFTFLLMLLLRQVKAPPWTQGLEGMRKVLVALGVGVREAAFGWVVQTTWFVVMDIMEW